MLAKVHEEEIKIKREKKKIKEMNTYAFELLIPIPR